MIARPSGDAPKMNLSRALELGRERLSSESAARDARLLLAFTLGVPIDRLALVEDHMFTENVLAEYQGFLARRNAGEPVSHIRGVRAFWTHEFMVSADVLDPRPETEVLVAAALELQFSRVLDLGVGSGCILLSLLSERPDATGCGIDVSDAALAVAAHNRNAMGLSARAELRRSDWFAELGGEVFDLIVSNPPYISEAEYQGLSQTVRRYEPRIALTPGADGVAPYREIAKGARSHLSERGTVLVEIGYNQGQEILGIFENAGFNDVSVRQDLDGRDRVVIARVEARK